MPDSPPSVVIKTPVSATTKRSLTPVFGKFVTRNEGFVDYLEAVRAKIITYIEDPKVRRPLNIFLAAPPGSGKSFLIKQLISDIEPPISFEEIYIASLDDVSELYNLFQRVQSLNLEGKIPAIFFDEIDSQIGGSWLYAKFLAPMWDGTFYIGKDKYFLGRSIFFFAGSTLSNEPVSEEIIRAVPANAVLSYKEYFERWKKEFDNANAKADEKRPDFMDRIDVVVRIPPLRRELLGDDLQVEYEDLAITLIRKHFPDVTLIGKVALKEICDALIDGTSMRRAEKIVFSSKRGDPGVFSVKNLPKTFRSDADKPEEEEFWEIVKRVPATSP